MTSDSLNSTPEPEGKVKAMSPWFDGMSTLVYSAATALKYRRVVVLAPLILMLITGITGLFAPRDYTSSMEFVPQASKDDAGGAGAIAASFGLGIPGSDLTQTPDFYASLARSDELLRGVAETPYHVMTDDGPQNQSLLTLYGLQGSFAAARAKAVELFRPALKVTTDLKTGVVQVSVTTDDPQLSYQVIQRILALIMRFNAETRRSQAHEERVYSEARLAEAQKALRNSEDSLQQFILEHRIFSQAPELQFEHDRLQRNLMLRQETLVQANTRYETARAAEVKNTPVITIVEKPFLPPKPDKRGLLVKVIISGFIGVIGALLFAFAREAMRDVSHFTGSSANLARNTWADTRADLELVAEKTGVRRLLHRPLRSRSEKQSQVS
jgi:uncharacterized protein involved in exopolysaccharide biosynthesis